MLHLGDMFKHSLRIVQEPRKAGRKMEKEDATTWAVILPTVFPDTKQASMDPNLIFQ